MKHSKQLQSAMTKNWPTRTLTVAAKGIFREKYHVMSQIQILDDLKRANENKNCEPGGFFICLCDVSRNEKWSTTSAKK